MSNLLFGILAALLISNYSGNIAKENGDLSDIPPESSSSSSQEAALPPGIPKEENAEITYCSLKIKIVTADNKPINNIYIALGSTDPRIDEEYTKLGGKGGVTNNFGEIDVTDLPVGELEVIASNPDGAGKDNSAVYHEPINAGNSPQIITLTWEKETPIESVKKSSGGIIIKLMNGELPVSGVKLSFNSAPDQEGKNLWQSPRIGYTDENGEYGWSNAADTEYSVTAEKDGIIKEFNIAKKHDKTLEYQFPAS